MSISGAIRPTHSDPAAGAGLHVPVAIRHQRPGWRDPRILVGVGIIVVSVLLAVKLLAAADRTVPVWAAAHDLPVGTEVSAGDLTSVRVRFAEAEQADRYLSSSQDPPTGAVLSHTVAAGELLPRAAVDAQGAGLVEVPVSVEIDDVPATVKEGSVVDIWVTPTTATTADKMADATRVLNDVVVTRAEVSDGGLAPTGTRQIIVGVPESDAEELGPALGKTSAGQVLITKQG